MDEADSGVVTLRPRTVATCLAGAIVVLLCLHTLSQVLRFGYGYETQLGFAERVYFGAELSIPAWFASSLILLCGLLLLWIARATYLRGGPGVPYWTALGAIFVVLSADEAASLHELTSQFFVGTMGWLGESVGGIFVPLADKAPGYAWVIPGFIGTFILGLVFLRFLALLPVRTRLWFIAAGAVFVGGALGLEVLGARYSALYGPNTVGFVTIMTLEETFEKVGMSMFLFALLQHIEMEFGMLQLRLGGSRSARLRRVA